MLHLGRCDMKKDGVDGNSDVLRTNPWRLSEFAGWHWWKRQRVRKPSIMSLWIPPTTLDTTTTLMWHKTSAETQTKSPNKIPKGLEEGLSRFLNGERLWERASTILFAWLWRERLWLYGISIFQWCVPQRFSFDALSCIWDSEGTRGEYMHISKYCSCYLFINDLTWMQNPP